ncbi:hypothetical protein WDZ92_18015, partial [Nostoc sp. NIES-2111]
DLIKNSTLSLSSNSVIQKFTQTWIAKNSDAIKSLWYQLITLTQVALTILPYQMKLSNHIAQTL